MLSDLGVAYSEVQQGSVPLLLNICVNNLKLDNNSTVITYADDIAPGDVADTGEDKGVYTRGHRIGIRKGNTIFNLEII